MHHGGVLWCTDEGKGDLGYERGTSVRIAATFSPEDYAELQRLAERNRVSLAWVVGDAVERYLEGETPLFLKTKKASG